MLQDVAVDVESVVAIVINDEWVDQGILLHEDDRNRQQEEIGRQ